jgi:hypothetical protein
MRIATSILGVMLASASCQQCRPVNSAHTPAASHQTFRIVEASLRHRISEAEPHEPRVTHLIHHPLADELSHVLSGPGRAVTIDHGGRREDRYSVRGICIDSSTAHATVTYEDGSAISGWAYMLRNEGGQWIVKRAEFRSIAE